MAPTPIELIEERHVDPPRAVMVEHHGRWWPAQQRCWRPCDDGRGWRADVEWSEQYDWDWARTCPLCRHNGFDRPRTVVFEPGAY